MKKNKFKVGQKVKALPRLIDWHATHLCWSYSRLVEDEDGRQRGERDIKEQEFEDVYFWVYCKLKNKMPIGEIMNFGSKNEGLYCLGVVFSIETDLGKIKHGTYVEEKDVVAINKRVKK